MFTFQWLTQRQRSNLVHFASSTQRKLLSVLILVTFTFLQVQTVVAADGDLDPTFGSGGKVITTFNPAYPADAYALAIQNDGKIVVVGYGADTQGWSGFALARFTAEGLLDNQFGSGGKVVTRVGGGEAYAVAIQSDGKIVVAGYGGGDFIVARYRPDGGLDLTFGSNGLGYVATDIVGSYYEYARAVAIQPDGKIVVAGYAKYTETQGPDVFAVVRYHPNGALDTAFDGDGKVTTHFDVRAHGYGMALQSDGKIVVVGGSFLGQRDILLARYNEFGALDTSFGSNGLVKTAGGYAEAVALQSDGKIVIAGTSSGFGVNPNFLVARYNSDGSLDAQNFGTQGKTVTDVTPTSDWAHALAIQPDGKIVVAGQAGQTTDANFAVARYTSDGSLDQTFGTGGKVTTDIDPNNSYDGDNARAIAIQPADNKIVVAGSGAARKFVVARYLSNVNRTPTANDLTVSTDEDTAVSIVLSGSDADGDLLTFGIKTAPQHGSLTGTAPDLTYTPNTNFHGGDNFTFIVNDGKVDSMPATVDITVRPVNDAPVAVADSADVDEDSVIDIAVLNNDSDLDNDTLSVSGVANPANGTAAINSDRTVRYTPNANYCGSDAFTYAISDGNGGDATANVNMDVTCFNDNPSAAGDRADVNEDSFVDIAVLRNDSDLDGDTLSVSGVTNPTNGTAAINPDNTVKYTPNANYCDSDAFTYTISDGNGGTATADVRMNVLCVNDAPVAVGDSSSTPQNTAVIIDVLANDSDVDEDTLLVAVRTPPANGTLTLNGDNSFTYRPSPGFTGEDTFEYSVSDNKGGSVWATVTVNVVSTGNTVPTLSTINAPLAPVPVGVQIQATASFGDPDVGDTHVATWNWGDGTSSPGEIGGVVAASNQSFNSAANYTVDGRHTYQTPGVYTIQLAINDGHDIAQAVFQYVVVYDPNGGFVTGGGWIWSEAGWCRLDPACAEAQGKAHFGFVSRYKKGATAPIGNTAFQFSAGNLNFYSTTYEWLVVAGAKAQFKGSGTINETGNYGFMLTATDADLTPSTDVDLFRIKIWDKDRDGFVVYDNQMGSEDNTDPTTAIGGGNIVIHTSKSKSGSVTESDMAQDDDSHTIYLPVVSR